MHIYLDVFIYLREVYWVSVVRNAIKYCSKYIYIYIKENHSSHMPRNKNENGPFFEEGSDNEFEKNHLERQHDSIMLMQKIVNLAKDLCMERRWEQIGQTFKMIDEFISTADASYKLADIGKKQDIIIETYNKLMRDLRHLYFGRKHKLLAQLLNIIKDVSDDLYTEISDHNEDTKIETALVFQNSKMSNLLSRIQTLYN
jgi:hypothetical protein